MKKEFKIGDLVRIKETTHDPLIPENRLGLLVEKQEQKQVVPSPVKYTYTWVILMTNNKSLVFHEMFLEHSLESNKDEKAE